MVLQGTHIGLTTHLLLVYPGGILKRRDGVLVGIAYVGLFAANLLRLLVWNPERPGLCQLHIGQGVRDVLLS